MLWWSVFRGVPALSILIYAAVRRQEPTFVDRIKEIHQHRLGHQIDIDE
jgi:hypothetical protein